MEGRVVRHSFEKRYPPMDHLANFFINLVKLFLRERYSNEFLKEIRHPPMDHLAKFFFNLVKLFLRERFSNEFLKEIRL